MVDDEDLIHDINGQYEPLVDPDDPLLNGPPDQAHNLETDEDLVDDSLDEDDVDLLEDDDEDSLDEDDADPSNDDLHAQSNNILISNRLDKPVSNEKSMANGDDLLHKTVADKDKIWIPIVQAQVLLYQSVWTLKPVQALADPEFLSRLDQLSVYWSHDCEHLIAQVQDPFFDERTNTVFAILRLVAPYDQNPPFISMYTPSLSFSAQVVAQRGFWKNRSYQAIFESLHPQHVALCLQPRNPSLRMVSPSFVPQKSFF